MENAEQVTVAVFDEHTGWRIDDAIIKSIAEHAGPGFAFRSVGSRAELDSMLPSTTVLIGFPITAEELAHTAPSVRFVQLTDSIGDAARPLVSALSRGVRVASAASLRASQLSEHAVAMLLALGRSLVEASIAQGQHRWATRELADRCRTLCGSTVGVAGPGPIRAEIERRLTGFDAIVIGIGDDPRAGERCVPHAQLTSVFPELDALIISAPLTPTTRRSVGKKALAQLPNHAMIIDVSRGGVLDHAAMLESLRRRRIAAVAIDGFESRPLPPTSPLWTMPNVLVSPGIAAARPDYWQRAAAVIGTNLRAFKANEPIQDELDPAWFAGAAATSLTQAEQ